ncbi:protein FAM228B isoform X2 [Gopherus evgoodei]|uniref:protein FAM228B isoform X2 n=1 Tax=Gopherus evgoodei TaxID=1825980 RepID=UPI0011CFC8B1|nr:protein FAM228B isoform X2 [Gopherus evgoodei]
MEARGSSAAKEGRAPSVPRPSLVPQDPACLDSITSLEARRGSLYEDWLIRVYCPGSQRMYDVQAPEQPVQGISPSVSEKIRTISTLCKRKSSKDWLMQEPSTPLQRVTSSLARSRSPSTFGRSASERKKACEEWLTQKRFSQVQEVDKYLRHRDFLELRKKEIQYKKWLECVSEPLLQKIEDKVDSQSSEEIEERKRKQLALYLNYCNKKGKVALEDYDSSEYDPLFLNTHPTYLKVSTPPLHDPLLKEVQGRFLEGGLIQQCETGRIYSAKEMNDLYKAKLPLLPLGRQNMDAAEWLKIPPGYIESEIRQRKRRRVKRSRNAGTLDFKAWADSTCPPIL